MALVHFRSGVEGTLTVEVISRPAIRAARIVGEEGTLLWDFGARMVRLWSRDSGWTDYPDPPPVEGPGGKWVAENMYIEEMRGFLRAIEIGSEHYPFSLREDAALLGALKGLERSSTEGVRTTLLDA